MVRANAALAQCLSCAKACGDGFPLPGALNAPPQGHPTQSLLLALAEGMSGVGIQPEVPPQVLCTGRGVDTKAREHALRSEPPPRGFFHLRPSVMKNR